MSIVGTIVNFLRHQTIWQLRRNGAIIGENVSLNSATIDYNSACLIEIGNNVTISMANILAHDASTWIETGYTKMANTIIGNNVFIGAGSVILPGSHVGDRVIIGAGSVVRGEVPGNSVFMGNPGRVVCSYDEYIAKNKERMKNAFIIDRALSSLNMTEKKEIREKLGDEIGFEV